VAIWHREHVYIIHDGVISSYDVRYGNYAATMTGTNRYYQECTDVITW
jgi:hypothetical protein